MKQACVYTMGDKLVAIAPLCGLEPKEEEFNTYYIGSGNTIAEAIGYAIMDWLGYSSCRHANVETQEDVGKDDMEKFIHQIAENGVAMVYAESEQEAIDLLNEKNPLPYGWHWESDGCDISQRNLWWAHTCNAQICQHPKE